MWGLISCSVFLLSVWRVVRERVASTAGAGKEKFKQSYFGVFFATNSLLIAKISEFIAISLLVRFESVPS